MIVKKRILNLLERLFTTGLAKIEKERSYKEQNIMEVAKKIATYETAEYVMRNMHSAYVASSKTELYDHVLKNFVINGEILEFGVFEGSTVNFFADKFPGRSVYGFDSFEGLPEKWRAGYERGAFDMKGSFPNVRNNVTLIKGWFESSIPEFLAANHIDGIGLLHVDCDLYSSTKTIFQLLGKGIKKGTIIILDEYFNYPGWREGEFKAFQEFIDNSGLSYQYIGFNANHEQVAVIIN